MPEGEDVEEDQFADEQEGEEEEKSSDEIETEEDVYEEDEREKQEEEDAISPTEEAFLEGYDEDENVSTCAKCGKSLLEMKKTVEREYKGKHFRFCSQKHADSFKFGRKEEE